MNGARALAILALSALTGCAAGAVTAQAAAPPAAAAASVIEGTATFRERIALPPNAEFEAVLQDVSRAGAAATEIGRTTLRNLPAPPIRFTVAYDPAAIDPARSYAVRAAIRVEGRLWFTSDTHHAVLTRGAGNTVEILLRRVGSASASDRAADEAALRELKEVLWPKAYFEQDVELLGRILAPEFQMVDGDGNWSTRAQELDWVRNNKPGYDSLTFEIKRLEVFENGTAIAAGTGTIRGTDENGPYVAQYQSTNVLIKRDGAWQAVASHVSGFRKIE